MQKSDAVYSSPVVVHAQLLHRLWDLCFDNSVDSADLVAHLPCNLKGHWPRELGACLGLRRSEGKGKWVVRGTGARGGALLGVDGAGWAVEVVLS